MGYRSRLGRVDKKEKERFVGLGPEEAMKLCRIENGNCTVYYPYFHAQIIELGKYLDMAEYDLIPFYDFDVDEHFESEFFIMSKESLKKLIEEYQSYVHSMYNEMTKDSFERYIRRKTNTWNPDCHIRPYYLDEEKTDGDIARSWNYEYSIFNLVYIYRTLDWDKEYLIYSAW